jgi:hypothetical protein
MKQKKGKTNEGKKQRQEKRKRREARRLQVFCSTHGASDPCVWFCTDFTSVRAKWSAP